jgi:hypothetical protein
VCVIRCAAHQVLSWWSNERGGACSTYGPEEKFIVFCGETRRKGNLDVFDRIMLTLVGNVALLCVSGVGAVTGFCEWV